MNKIGLPVIVCLLLAPGSSDLVFAATSDETLEQLRTCARIADESQRLACYEGLGAEAVAAGNKVESTAVTEDVPVTVVETSTVAVAAETNRATSAPTNVPLKSERSVEEYRVHVTACRISNVGDTYFVLDNGEVWKQTGGLRFRESECDFPATLRKDFFGFKMFLGDNKGSVRAKRVQ